MTRSRRAWRPAWLATCGLAFAVLVSAQPSAAPYSGPLFDAHLHYNADAQVAHPLADVLARLQRSGVRGVLANSTPGEGTRALAAALPQTRAAGLVVVPFVRLYDSRADYATWHQDADLLARAQAEFARGTAAGAYRGLGEVHLSGELQAQTRVVRALVAFAQAQRAVLLAHADDSAVAQLMADAVPAGGTLRVIWAHTGISGVPAARVDEWMTRYPGLLGELSYRPDLLCSDGDAARNQAPVLCPEWRALLLKYASRFLIGSDTWVNPRWLHYEALMQSYRGWLGTLPAEAATQIAWGNAARLFGLAEPK
ncbi:MAG: amidohydrolase [Burkholderiaceae bacterium]